MTEGSEAATQEEVWNLFTIVPLADGAFLQFISSVLLVLLPVTRSGEAGHLTGKFVAEPVSDALMHAPRSLSSSSPFLEALHIFIYLSLSISLSLSFSIL